MHHFRHSWAVQHVVKRARTRPSPPNDRMSDLDQTTPLHTRKTLFHASMSRWAQPASPSHAKTGCSCVLKLRAGRSVFRRAPRVMRSLFGAVLRGFRRSVQNFSGTCRFRYKTRVQNRRFVRGIKWRARTQPFGYLIPEDLYIQVGAR